MDFACWWYPFIAGTVLAIVIQRSWKTLDDDANDDIDDRFLRALERRWVSRG